MANTCAEILANQLKNCDSPVTTGNEGDLYIANRDDIQGYILDAVNPNIVRGITMKTGKKFFKYEGSRTSLKPRFTTVRKINLGITQYKHELDAVIFNWDSATKKEIESLANGNFVAIVVNKYKASDAAVEIYGTEIGMLMKDGAVRDLNGTDFGANFPFGLESLENEEENHVPASFAVLSTGSTPAYSYTATITALDALTIAAA